jgi:hypothetical protein
MIIIPTAIGFHDRTFFNFIRNMPLIGVAAHDAASILQSLAMDKEYLRSQWQNAQVRRTCKHISGSFNHFKSSLSVSEILLEDYYLPSTCQAQKDLACLSSVKVTNI